MITVFVRNDQCSYITMHNKLERKKHSESRDIFENDNVP